MTTVINVPKSLTDRTFEDILEQLAPLPADEKILVDARHTEWASPYGLTGLLVVGKSRAERATFAVPERDDTASYWSRAAFFKEAAEVYELSGKVPRPSRTGPSSVLLPVTAISQSADIHNIVDKVTETAQRILIDELNLERGITGRFTMALSEICQNIVEHAGSVGWAAVQTYRWQKQVGRRVVNIAVCDAGIGFRQSMESAPNFRPSDRWDDARALEETVINGKTRFLDSGRGQGLAGVRRFCVKWDGLLTVRSGTARVAQIPSWSLDDEPVTKGLAPFPGGQVQIVIPERVKT